MGRTHLRSLVTTLMTLIAPKCPPPSSLQEELVSKVEKMRQAILEGINLTRPPPPPPPLPPPAFLPPTMVPPFYPMPPLYPPRPMGGMPPHHHPHPPHHPAQHRPRAFPGPDHV